MSKKLENQVAWVSGGTSGIGAAICELFAREGAKIVLTGRNSERGMEVVESVRTAGSEAVSLRRLHQS